MINNKLYIKRFKDFFTYIIYIYIEFKNYIMSNIDDDHEKKNLTNIIYDENLKEVLRIARNNVDPIVDPFIKKIDGNNFYCITNKMNSA